MKRRKIREEEEVEKKSERNDEGWEKEECEWRKGREGEEDVQEEEEEEEEKYWWVTKWRKEDSLMFKKQAVIFFFMSTTSNCCSTTSKVALSRSQIYKGEIERLYVSVYFWLGVCVYTHPIHLRMHARVCACVRRREGEEERVTAIQFIYFEAIEKIVQGF